MPIWNPPDTFTVNGANIETNESFALTAAGKSYGFQSGAKIYSGSADPEASVTAVVGCLYLRTSVGAYYKATGTGNTGWALIVAGFIAMKSETFSDANKTVSAGTQYLAQTGTMTASRTVTLPAASGYPRGTQLIIADESGTTSVVFTLVIAGAGLDTINGVTSITIGIAGGYDTITLMPDGISKWTVLSKI